jgi:Fe-S cluster assembly protein SufD
MTLAPEKPQTYGPGRPAANLTDRLSSRNPEDFSIPGPRDEQWRFTPLDRLAGLHEVVPAGTTLDITFNAPSGASVETVGRKDARLGVAFEPVDRPSAAAWQGFDKAVVVTVPKNSVVAEPITVTLTGRGEIAATHIRVDVEPFASATVVLDHRGSAVVTGNIEVTVGDGASLTLVTVHDWDDDAVHLSHIQHRVGRDSTLRSIVVTLGGAVVRVLPSVQYSGPGGDATLTGLYFADANQHLEHRVLVDHNEPNCRSRVVYKGALQGSEGSPSRTVWFGDVLIRANATGTDTYELNRNLVLSDHARADSVPNLEIETGEVVGAGHASTTGRFDDEQLFYLMSRGITQEDARRLVVRGFFADVLDGIGVPDLVERLRVALERELARAGA